MARILGDLVECFILTKHLPAVRARACHRYKCLGHFDDRRFDRDIICFQMKGIAGPVRALVVIAHYVGHPFHADYFPQDPHAAVRMLFDFEHFGIAEQAGLEHGCPIHSYVTHIVQHRRMLK
jgi:hypothetical protein